MIVIMEKRELPVVALAISNPFGGAFEDAQVKGIAHVMEHLVFTGTKTRTHEDISREIEKRGGIINAFTAHEVTSFYFKLPSEHVFAGLDILVDILKNPTFKEEKFEKEKKVILEEIKMYHDDPRRFISDLLERELYEPPFGASIIGSAESVSKLKRDFVVEYYKKQYASSNLFVTIVGDADFEEICRYLEKQFPAQKAVLEEKPIVKKQGMFVEEREGIDQAHFMVGMHAPLMHEYEHTVLEVLDAYLANGMSSRLFLKIREEKGLAYAVKSSISAEKNYAYYAIYVGTRKEAVEEVKQLILEELKQIEKMSERDLAEAKEMLIGLRKISKEESSGVMQELLFAELSGKAEEYYQREERIKQVKLDEVKQLAEKLQTNYSTAAIIPK